MLSFVVLACHFNTIEPSETNPDCKVFKEPIYESMEVQSMTPMKCMQDSVVRVVTFEKNHPGWQVRKWSCRPQNPDNASNIN